MRGFRGNRAIQNQFSSRYGNQGTGTSYQRPTEGQKQGDGTARPRPDLPDWMKTPETLAAEKTSAKAAAPAPAPAPFAQQPKLRVIEGGAAKTEAKTTEKVTAKAKTKPTGKSPTSKGRKLSVVSARKPAGRKAA
jgi:hypothetical protein